MKREAAQGDLGNLRKQQIIDCIRDYRAAHRGVSPTYKEIADAVYEGGGSQGNIHKYVAELIAEGFLVQVTTGSRSLQLAEPLPREVYFAVKGQVSE